MNSRKTKKLVRELQALGGGAVSYTACLRLFEERGFDAAKKQVEQWAAVGDSELAALKEKSV